MSIEYNKLTAISICKTCHPRKLSWSDFPSPDNSRIHWNSAQGWVHEPLNRLSTTDFLVLYCANLIQLSSLILKSAPRWGLDTTTTVRCGGVWFRGRNWTSVFRWMDWFIWKRHFELVIEARWAVLVGIWIFKVDQVIMIIVVAVFQVVIIIMRLSANYFHWRGGSCNIFIKLCMIPSFITLLEIVIVAGFRRNVWDILGDFPNPGFLCGRFYHCHFRASFWATNDGLIWIKAALFIG